MDNSEDLNYLPQIIKELKRRRYELILKSARLGYSADPSNSTEISDLDNKLENHQRLLDALNNGNNNQHNVQGKYTRRILHIEKLIDLWNAHLSITREGSLNTNNSNTYRTTIKKVQRHLSFLEERRDFIQILNNSDMEAENLYSYARDLLFRVCEIQKDTYMMQIIENMLIEEIEETLREARYCIDRALRKGLEKGPLLFRLAALSYELDDGSPENVYEYCMLAIKKNYDYPEVHRILAAVCEVLSAYPNDYREESIEWLNKYKQQLSEQGKRYIKNTRKRSIAVFCTN